VRWQVGDKRRCSGVVPGDCSPVGALNLNTGILAGTSMEVYNSDITEILNSTV